MRGVATHSDDYYTYEYLLELSLLTIHEATKKAGMGSDRLQRLWKDHGIKREPRRSGSNRHISTKSITDDQLKSWAHMTNREISKTTGLAENTIRKLYVQRGIGRVRCRNGNEREWLPNTPEPKKCPPGGCEACVCIEECRERGERGLPLLGEGLTEDDLEIYVEDVMRRVAA